MGYANTETEWGTIAKTLHWLIAGLILLQLCIGWVLFAEVLPPRTQVRLILSAHVPIGITILGLAVIRVLWRFGNAHPPMPNMTWWERFLARASHAYLYIGAVAMPLTGWTATNAFGTPVKWFGGIELPRITAKEAVLAPRPLTTLFSEAHFWIAAGLTVFILLHVAGALRHHFSQKDNVLVRMAPAGWLKPR
ncbi:MAG: cytochrome b [Rhodospirillaceae bacterium]|nr:cytochrome b [Rhodospirillaceae bacterium]